MFDARGRLRRPEVMAQDVTRRVEAELWLRQSERKYRRLVEEFRGRLHHLHARRRGADHLRQPVDRVGAWAIRASEVVGPQLARDSADAGARRSRSVCEAASEDDGHAGAASRRSRSPHRDGSRASARNPGVVDVRRRRPLPGDGGHRQGRDRRPAGGTRSPAAEGGPGAARRAAHRAAVADQRGAAGERGAVSQRRRDADRVHRPLDCPTARGRSSTTRIADFAAARRRSWSALSVHAADSCRRSPPSRTNSSATSRRRTRR